MEALWSPQAHGLDPYVPGEQPNPGERLIKLNTNENPFPPSPRVREAIQAALNDLRLYPDPTSLALREAIAAHNGHGLKAENIFVGNGSDEVLAFCFPAFFTGRQLPLRFADITYSFYKVYAKLFDTPYIPEPLLDDFSMPLDALCEKPCAGLLIANPNAPTGIALDLDDIERLLKAHPDAVILVDEAYVDFGARAATPLLAQYPNLLIVRTLSKSHALAGLRVGYAMGHPYLIEALVRVKDSINSYPLDRLAQAGAQAAVADGAYVAARCAEVATIRDDFIAALEQRGFDVLPSKANLIFARPPKGDAAGLMAALRQHGILVRHFSSPRIADRLRISMGLPEEMATFLQVLDNLPVY